MLLASLKVKLSVALGVVLTAIIAAFTTIIISHHRNELLEETVEAVSQLSQVIIRSTRYAMLRNQRDNVHRIIDDIGSQPAVERVRIISKGGMVIHSTYVPEIGTKIDKEAEACILCHDRDEPLGQLPTAERTRIYRSPLGYRLLGMIEVIRNEPACSASACHIHPASQQVLGVLDITYSLDDLDARTARNTRTTAALSAGLVVVTSLFLVLLLHRTIYLPLRDLEYGAKQVSMGNLDHPIPVRSNDEIGHLEESFNRMTTALKHSQEEVNKWARTLEEKVREKTRELRAAEARAVQTDKLASVGLLAAGIAHELNSPLTAILTFSHLLRKDMPAGSPAADDMDLVIRETKRCAGIIKRLLDFAREKTPEMNFHDLNRVVQEVVDLVEHQASFHDITIAREFDTSLPPVWMDANQMKQVFMNILRNGIEAIEKEGTVTIRTRIPDRGEESLPREAPASSVEVTFEDTGGGISPDILPRIFDPFFTSKDVGKGVGLGLSVTYGIVQAHGGTISVESTVGGGSAFRVFLPLEHTPAHKGVSNERQDTRSG